MKKLITIAQNDQVTGMVIEIRDNSFVMNRYGKNNYGEYEEMGLVDELEFIDEKAVDVFTQKTFEARKRRLHNYFRSAEYISEEVVDMLKRADILQKP